MNVQAEMRILITRHCETLRLEAEAVRVALERLNVPGATGVLESSVQAAHKIKGSSGTIGFLEVSEIAADLEMALRSFAASGQSPRGPALEGLRRHCGELVRAVSILQPEDSRLYDMEATTLGA